MYAGPVCATIKISYKKIGDDEVEKRKRRLGDRYDGRKIRTLDPMNRVAIFIMKDRNDASNLFSDSVDSAAVDKYILKKRKEGYKGFGLMHVILAAYLRTIVERPALNRFISGQTIFNRYDVVVALTIKKSMELNAQETVVKIKFDRTDGPKEVYEKINAIVEENKQEGDQSSFDKVARLVNLIPRTLLRAFIGVMKLLDYYGIMPKVIEEVSPFHASMFITSMGSLGIPPIYHHLYNFGNVPVFIAFGAKRPEMVLEKDGSVKQHWFIDYRCTLDERICDGFYYASGLKVFRDYLKNPDKLDEPIETIIEDVD